MRSPLRRKEQQAQRSWSRSVPFLLKKQQRQKWKRGVGRRHIPWPLHQSRWDRWQCSSFCFGFLLTPFFVCWTWNAQHSNLTIILYVSRQILACFERFLELKSSKNKGEWQWWGEGEGEAGFVQSDDLRVTVRGFYREERGKVSKRKEDSCSTPGRSPNSHAGEGYKEQCSPVRARNLANP